MCVVSMIFDHYYDKWKPQPALPYQFPYVPKTIPVNPPMTPAEIEEFRKLLERARIYDKEHSQPDCELEEKRKKLKDLSKELGVEINFI